MIRLSAVHGHFPPHTAGPGRLLLAVAALAAATSLGCGDGAPTAPPPDDGAERLSEVGNAYVMFAQEKQRPPKSAEELAARLPAIAQSDYLVSTRDGQPYVILWGTEIKGGMGESPRVIGYEQQGAKGFRYVLTAMGVMMMDEEGFARASFPEGHQPPR